MNRLKLLIKITIFSIMLFLLITCKSSISFVVYIGDIFEASEQGYIFYTPVEISFESPSASKLDEVKNQIKKSFRDVEKFDVVKVGYSDYLSFITKIPVYNEGMQSAVKENDLLGLIVKDTPEGVKFGLYFNSKFYDSIDNYASESYYSSIPISEMSLQLAINNDLPKNVTIQLTNVYANEIPVVEKRNFTLAKRESTKIRISNVMRDYLYYNEIIYWGMIVSD